MKTSHYLKQKPGTNPVSFFTMTKRIIICPGCDEEKPHRAKGLCRRCYNRQYRAANIDTIRENRKHWEGDNKESRAAYNRQWRADHPEQDREQYLKHAEKKRERSRQWRADHPDDAKTYSGEHKEESKQWRVDHPDYAKTYRREHPKERRDYVTPAGNCAHLNTWFEGCERHHINPGTIIHIPAEMHTSIWHSIQTGVGMNEVNRLAFAFLNGQRNASAQMTISDF